MKLALHKKILLFFSSKLPFPLSITTVKSDAIAGLTVALVLIPQAIAYAQLAGLPPQYGLYASLLPPVLAALFGSSRFLSTGPVALISLLTASALALVPMGDKSELLGYVILLAFLVGLIQIALGVLRLGVLVNFISHPVLIGFSNAAAIIIATSQLPKLFGVSVENYQHHYETLYNFMLSAFQGVHVLTMLVSLYALIVIVALRIINPKIPGVLAVVVITTLFSYVVQYERLTVVPLTDFFSTEIRSDLEKYMLLTNELSQKNSEYAALSKKDQGGYEGNAAIEHALQLQRLQMEVAYTKKRLVLEKEQLKQKRFLITDSNHVVPVDASYPKGQSVWQIRLGESNQKIVTLASGGNIVGTVPAGLPAFSVPPFSFDATLKFLSSAFIIALLGFMESISIGKSLAVTKHDHIDANRELIGQGIANIAGAFTQAYPVSGSFSRSAVNYRAGAKSSLSNVFASFFILLALLFFTPWLYYLPQAVLAVIIMLSVLGLVKFDSVIAAWKANKSDSIIAIITFIVTLFFAPDIEKGILIGVILSIGYYIYSRTHPKISFLSTDPTGTFLTSHPATDKRCKHIMLVRFDGSLFFADASYLETSIYDRLHKDERDIKYIILIANGIHYIDYTGEEALMALAAQLKEMKKTLVIVKLKTDVFDTLRASGVIETIGEKHFYQHEKLALCDLYKPVHTHRLEKDCPLLPFIKAHC